MRKNYDFSEAKRGPLLPIPSGKTCITIRIDDDLLEWFRKQVHAAGGGNYQTMINKALRDCMERHEEPLEATLRRVLLEVLSGSGRGRKLASAGSRKTTRRGTS